MNANAKTGYTIMAMHRVGPQISADMEAITQVVSQFGVQCLDTLFAINRDYDGPQDWERVSMVSQNPQYNITVVFLDYCEDLSITVLINGTTVVETNTAEDIFDILVEALDPIEGETSI